MTTRLEAKTHADLALGARNDVAMDFLCGMAADPAFSKGAESAGL